MITALLLLTVASAFPPKHDVVCRPIPGDSALERCYTGWVPADAGYGACPAFTHLHALVLTPGNDADLSNDGLCHRDDNDAVYLAPPTLEELRAWR